MNGRQGRRNKRRHQAFCAIMYLTHLTASRRYIHCPGANLANLAEMEFESWEGSSYPCLKEKQVARITVRKFSVSNVTLKKRKLINNEALHAIREWLTAATSLLTQHCCQGATDMGLKDYAMYLGKYIHSFFSLAYDGYTNSFKASSPQRAI